jgi:hypothetical protein
MWQQILYAALGAALIGVVREIIIRIGQPPHKGKNKPNQKKYK